MDGLPPRFLQQLEVMINTKDFKLYDPGLFAQALVDREKREVRRAGSEKNFSKVFKMTMKDVFPLEKIEVRRLNFGGHKDSNKKYKWRLHASFDNNMLRAFRDDLGNYI